MNAILNSTAKKKIVVAGPGTGKTYLFKQAVNGRTNSLVLTFVNALVEDLSLELSGLAEVRTLHSYARGVLASARPGRTVKVFPRLSQVVAEDAAVLLGKDIDFDYLFHNRDDNSEHVPFYKTRKDYYGHYGYSDIVFAAVKILEQDEKRVPTYDQIIVDEFQDFNRLEVSLIDRLAEKSPVLLTGDDDQALYHFKSASADYIRNRYSGAEPGYEPFSLPYCSRSTRVIVDAANDIISHAKAGGHLVDRAEKSYCYFEDEEKDGESEEYPAIALAQVYAQQMPWFIEKQVEKLADAVRGQFSVLVISPTKTQCRDMVEGLRRRGFGNVEAVERKEAGDVSVLDGFKILLDDEESNLGWRIVSKCLLRKKEFEGLLRMTHEDSKRPVIELVDAECKAEVKKALRVLRAVRKDGNVDEGELAAIMKKCGYDPHRLSLDHLRSEIDRGSQRTRHPGLGKLSIKSTTIPSSKGLAADFVFITHFDDRYFIKNRDKEKVTDNDICNYLVALTRAKRKVFLVSSDKKKVPTFLKWIKSERIEEIS